MDNRETTIEDVRDMCRRGAFRAYAHGEAIYLEDTYTSRIVRLNSPVPKPGGDFITQSFSASTHKKALKPFREFHDGEGPYKGFLMVKCEGCGEIKAFCAKRETYGFRCDVCKEQTPLENLRPMFMRCKCGKDFRYKTNLTDKCVTHTCISCHAPVDMELNRRGTAYVTIDEGR